MFNRYFEAGEDSMEFLFAHMAVKNIDFALISLNCVLDPQNINYDLFRDEHTYYFFHIQSILAACGNLYNIFYGHTYGEFSKVGMANRPSQINPQPQINRPQRLRSVFGVGKRQFPLVFDKSARNTNAHFDERFDALHWNVGDYNLLDDDMDPEMRAAIMNQRHLRTFDRRNGCYYTYGRKNKQLQRVSVDFRELMTQLQQMREQIVSHPIFESRWVDRMPGDILE